MPAQLPQPNRQLTGLLALAGAVFLAALLFLIIPISQALQDSSVQTVILREVDPVVLTPPKPPVIEEKRQIERTPDKIPELEPEPPELELSQLELSLNPGVGEALSMGVQAGDFQVQVDAIGDIEKIFDFAELERPPNLINRRMIKPDFPRELERRGVKEVKLTLEILIDQKGKARFQKILASSHSHPKLDQEARRLGNLLRFTITKVDGQPVKVRAKFPFTLQSPR